VSFLSGSTGAYFWVKGKFFTSKEIPNPEIPTQKEKKIPS